MLLYLKRPGYGKSSEDSDDPLLPEDRGAFAVKSGTVKRVRDYERPSNSRFTSQEDASAPCRYLGGVWREGEDHCASSTTRSPSPTTKIDQVYGLLLDVNADFNMLQQCILRRRPYLLVYETPCAAWINIQNLNYEPHELQALRAKQGKAIRRVVDTIITTGKDYDGHFLFGESSLHRVLETSGCETTS